MEKTAFKYRLNSLRNRQRGMTLAWALAAVALLSIIILSVDIPNQIKQQRKYAAIAGTNAIVQFSSAVLSYHHENSGVFANLSDMLNQYLPVLPSDLDAIVSGIDESGKYKLLVNANTYANAKKLAWQFSDLAPEVVDPDNAQNSEGTWVKITLDTQIYGRWEFPDDSDPNVWSPCSNGKQTITSTGCANNGQPYLWCLGSKMKARNCISNVGTSLTQ